MADLRASMHRWVALLMLITRAPVLGESSPARALNIPGAHYRRGPRSEGPC